MSGDAGTHDGRCPDGGWPADGFPDDSPAEEELTPEELDEAIGLLREYVAASPGDTDARAALADALCDRYAAWGLPDGGGEPDPAGLAAAREDWREAVGLVGGLVAVLDPGDPADERWPQWAERYADLLGLGYSLDEMSDPGDQDLLIVWGTWLLGRVPDPAMVPADTGLRIHLAGALDDRIEAGRGDRDADCRALIEQLEGMLAQPPGGGPDRAGLLGMATLAYARLADGDPGLAEREPAVVDRMTALARQAWQALGPDWEDWPLVGLMLAAGIEEQLRRPGAAPPDLATLDFAIDVLTEVERRLAGDFAPHLVTEALLGLFLAARAQLAGSAGDIRRAGPVLLHAAQAVPAGDPSWDDVARNIGVAMSIAAHMGFESQYFAPAIGLLRDSVTRASGDAERDAATREMLGVLLVEQSFGARSPDAREGIGHLRAAYEIAPPGTATRLRIALNLGILQAGQYCETGDRQQLQAAEFYLAAARELKEARTAGHVLADLADLDALLASAQAHVALARALDGDDAAADVAVESLRAAAGLLPAGHPRAARLGSDLGLALLTRAARESFAPAARPVASGGHPAARHGGRDAAGRAPHGRRDPDVARVGARGAGTVVTGRARPQRRGRRPRRPARRAAARLRPAGPVRGRAGPPLLGAAQGHPAGRRPDGRAGMVRGRRRRASGAPGAPAACPAAGRPRPPAALGLERAARRSTPDWRRCGRAAGTCCCRPAPRTRWPPPAPRPPTPPSSPAGAWKTAILRSPSRCWSLAGAWSCTPRPP